MKKTVIFDFDGTIADTFDIGLQVTNELARKFGKQDLSGFTVDEIKQMTARDVLKNLKIPFWRVKKAVDLAQKGLLQRIDEITVFDGITSLLKELKNHHFLGIVTSNSEANVHYVLNKYSITDFDFITTGSKVFGKVRILKKIKRSRNLRKQDMIYVGDETRDIVAANRFGIKSIAVTWGYNSGDLLSKCNPDFLVDTPQEIAGVLRIQ